MSDIYEQFDRSLYKIVDAGRIQTNEIDPLDIGSGPVVSTIIQNVGALSSGKIDFTNIDAGYILGVDKGVSKFYIGDSSNYMNWTGTSLSISGTLSAGAIDIGGSDATSFHVDSDGNLWLGASTFAAAPASISNVGAIIGSNVTITGGSISGTTTVGIANVNIAARGWTQTSVFSVTDADTVAWGAGTFTSADGTAYSISGSNTGNMAAATYIYLDIGVSTTAYQTTTTAATAVGAGKVLIAKAQNGTGEATFQVFGGIGGQNIDAASIVANSITANELSTSITYAGSIIIDTAGLIRSGQTAYDTGTGWWIGNDGGTPKLSIGNSAGNKITWNGSTLTVVGTIVGGTFYRGNGSDGAVTISVDTTLTGDKYYSSLTVNNGVTLNTGSCRIFCSGTVTNNGTISRTGNTGGNGGVGEGTPGTSGGTAGAAGAALAAGYMPAGSPGKAGGVGGTANPAGDGLTGTAGDNVTNSLGATSVAGVTGGTGGTGGLGDQGDGGLGGGAGTATAPSNSFMKILDPAMAALMISITAGSSPALINTSGGTGSSGGGGGGSGDGGPLRGGAGGGGAGSGSSGGFVFISAREIINAGTIGCNGGVGGNGGNGGNGTGGNVGGGGGGGGGSGGTGGLIVLLYSILTNTGTIQATGGAAGSGGTGGTGNGTGTSGATGTTGNAGASGNIIQIQLS